MEQLYLYILLISILSLTFILLTKQSKKLQPPSPPSIPVIGHLHLLSNKQPLHRTIQDLALKYGPIFKLKFGFVPVIIISSPAMLEECFTKNDVIFSNRPLIRAAVHFHYDASTIGAASYGPLWKDLRRVSTEEFFSTIRLNLLSYVRVEEVKLLMKGILNVTKVNEFVEIELRSKMFECSFNIIIRMLTGKRYEFGENAEGGEGADKVLHDLLKESFELSGVSNPIDFFPFLKWFNFRNLEGKMLELKDRIDDFLNGLIEDCREHRNDESLRKAGEKVPLIYKLFDLQDSDSNRYSDVFIKGIIMAILVGGIDTSVIAIEWALALLLNNPKELNKARSEVDNCIKNKDRLVDESDLDKLPFIYNVMNESGRLFPGGPLLVPHESSEDCTIGGYHVPKKTMLLVNAWTLQRDPNLWEDPLAFKPERFEGAKTSKQRYSFATFGHGRRSCPGEALANRVVTLILAALLQCFDWDRVDGMDVDLSEGSGLTMPMVTPLKALCKARSDMINVVSSL
ncbi:cytochrome P450 81Q32-like [Silene latifolia]|uniref:cytochrome P450 81Q32-like n=1 Tax=Silene latifolia TaxID=37657 RepID=UPI003D775854